MLEKTKWTFERSKTNHNLEDIQIEVELTPEELQLVLEIRQLEDSPEVKSEIKNGSGRVRDYLSGERIPFGGRLAEPREQLMEDLKKSRDYIKRNSEMIAQQAPQCSQQMQLIRTKLNQILGDKELSSQESEKACLPEEISFGNVFEFRWQEDGEDKTAKYIITNVGNITDPEGNACFSAARILSEEPDNERVGFNGGHNIKDIHKMLETWPLERVLSAVKRSFGSPKNLEGMVAGYTKNSQDPPRRITKHV